VPGEGYHRQLISCQVACPVHTDARGYVRAIADGRFEEAYLIARGPNPLASICGRVCGAPCEIACRRGKVPRVDAAAAKRFIDDPLVRVAEPLAKLLESSDIQYLALSGKTLRRCVANVGQVS
jgi:hypothetical protein